MNIEELCKNKKVLIISNAPCKEKERLQDVITQHDFIIRFHQASNSKIINNHPHLGTKTDLCCLNGSTIEDLKPIEGFQNKNILFTRPIYSQKFDNYYKKIHIKKNVVDSLKKVTPFLYGISWEIFYDIGTNFNYWHPTSGIVVLYCFAQILDKNNITCVNFFNDNLMFNDVTKKYMPPNTHNIELERKILELLELKNIKV